jgi:prepilin-type N-terminal cleavage/methylation domain-containing protein
MNLVSPGRVGRSPVDRERCTCAGVTLVEILVAMAVLGLTTTALLRGYVVAARQVYCTGYAQSAEGIALQRVEQTRAAKWDTQGSPVIDELQATNFPAQIVALDGSSSSPQRYATNFTQITTVSASPPLKMIRVDCVWTDDRRKLLTNTVVTLRAPDQ